MCAPTSDKSLRIGIMADSHGSAASIHSALKLFLDLGCHQIYHLGDICDSLQPETVDACIEPLRANQVAAIYGNNDHIILANLKSGSDVGISDISRRFLEALPLKRSLAYADMVHSLPFTEELGLASMIGSLGPVEAAKLFDSTSGRVVFRGHSHAQEVAWRQNGQIVIRALLPNQSVELNDLLPCIVTCGALCDGFCLMWEPARQRVTCLRVPGSEP